MQMPTAGSEHQRPAGLAGHWVGPEIIPFDPPAGMGTGRLSSRMALDGFYLVMGYEQ
jgi:hypothetical protein